MRSKLLPREAWETLRNILPFESCKRVYTNVPEDYPCWEAAMTIAVTNLINVELQAKMRKPVMPLQLREALLAIRAAECGFPMFWIDKGFMESLARTDVAPSIAIRDLAWPYEAMIFMLPKGSISHEKDGDCSWMIIGRNSGDHYLPISGATIRLKNPRICVVTGPHLMPKVNTYSHCMTASPELNPFLSDASCNNRYLRCDSEILEEKLNILAKADTDLSNSVLQLGLRIILAITSHPEMMDGEAVNGIQGDACRESSHYAQPRWIGKGYTIKVNPSVPSADDGGKQFRWRRGQFSRQCGGTGSGRSRITWTEPYLTCPQT